MTAVRTNDRLGSSPDPEALDQDVAPASTTVTRTLFKSGAGAGYLITSAPDDGTPTLEIEGLSAGRCAVIRMSPEAIWFTASAPRALAFNRLLSIHVRWSGGVIGPLRGEVVTIAAGDATAGGHFGLRLSRISIAAGRQILSMLDTLVREGRAEAPRAGASVREEITEGERIRMIARALSSVGTNGTLKRPGRAPIDLHVRSVDTVDQTITWKASTPASSWGEGPYLVDINGYNSVFRMEIERAADAGDARVVTPFPSRVKRVRHRFFRRGPAAGDTRARIVHPLWPDLTIEAEVRDLSFGGLCFTASAEDDLVFPGLVIPAIEVTGRDGESIYLRGEVRTVRPARGDEPGLCGVSITALSPEDDRLWIKLVTGTLHRNTRTSEELLEPLWSLFQDSGYFNLAGKSADSFVDLKRAFVDLGRRAATAPHLICQAVWPSPRGVEVTASLLKAYKHSWMAHQLAKRPGRPPEGVDDPGQMLREVYLRTFEHCQSDPDLEWLICYVEPTVPWIRKSKVDFAKKHADSGLVLAMSVEVLIASSSEPSGLVDPDLDIGPATVAERSLLAAVIAETRPAAYAAALDLVPARLGLDAIHTQWRAAGFERERAILVARRGGHSLAAVVMETGEMGTNLFRLLDGARLFSLAKDGSSTYVPLLDAARTWYANRGRESFLFIREDDDDSALSAARLHHESNPCLWVLSSSLLPDFLEHVCELVGKRRFSP